MKKLFVSGTDTGVGKTLVSGLLCRQLLEEGYKVCYYKPVQTGAIVSDQELISVDTEFVKSICSPSLKIIDSQMFKLPASPHLAAAEEGQVIDVQKFVDKVDAVDEVDYLIVEGAGGLSVPFNDECDMALLCQKISAELIVVARPNLGTLNHTFLTVDYAEKFALPTSIIISGCSQNPDIIESDNIKMLRNKVSGRLLGKVPLMEDLDTEVFEGQIIPPINFDLTAFK